MILLLWGKFTPSIPPTIGPVLAYQTITHHDMIRLNSFPQDNIGKSNV